MTLGANLSNGQLDYYEYRAAFFYRHLQYALNDNALWRESFDPLYSFRIAVGSATNRWLSLPSDPIETGHVGATPS